MRILLALVCITNLLCPLLQAQTVKDDTGEWYPFVIPEKLDPGSPMNIGKIVLDAPAGKHGFVTVKDGHFYFEDGTRAKFWGTNLCFSACFPTHKQAEMLADRIAFFGFNAVRLHHMDMHFAPRGIFEDIDPAYKDPRKKRTGILSKTQLDRLDYLIYQLKQRGIYIDMNLLVSRLFTEADGVKFAKELGMAAKPVSMFDPRLIELQKQYAKDLLTHLNSYTKLRYCEDPVIALAEMTNENSIIGSWQSNALNATIPEYYSKRLDILWNAWLQDKYMTPEKVMQAWYSNIQTPIISKENMLPSISSWQTEQHQNTHVSAKSTKSGVVLTVSKTTDVCWHAQYSCANIPLTKDKNYILKFTAKADRNIHLGLISQQAFPPWTNLGLSETTELTTDFQHFEIPFTASLDCANTKINFLIGYSPATLEIKDVSLYETSKLALEQTNITDFSFQRPLYKLRAFYPENRVKDAFAFYSYLERSYFEQMMGYLRRDIGFRAPVTGIGGCSSDDSLPGLQTCDFIDKHAYWDHPQFPGTPWDNNNFTIHNKSIFQEPGLGIIDALTTAGQKAAALGKPYTVTEWNHCYPNHYAYETPILLASAAAQNNWDAVFQFAFSHGWQTEPVLDEIKDFFDIMPNSQQLVLCAFGSSIFLKNDPVKYYFVDDGIIISSIGFGQVKNSSSGWQKEKFQWGTKPVLIKKIKKLPVF